MTEIVSKWLEYAESDYIAAQGLLRMDLSAVLGAVCFHSQQCIEKLMKAILIHNGQDVPKIHDLRKLSQLISPYCPGWMATAEELRFLTDANIQFRYPNMSAEEDEDATRAFDLCTRFRHQLLAYVQESSP